MVSVFDYTNYREYLADYYEEKKNASPGFSYQNIANKAGFKDKSTVYGAINGRRNLSKTAIFKLSQALKHNRYEAEYFENLVAFNQAHELRERNHYYEKMNQVKSYDKVSSKARLLREDQFEFYSRWYHSAIRSIIGMYPFKDDYTWLAKNVYPTITRKQAKKSIELLERLGLIKKQRGGVYALTDKNIAASQEVLSLAGQNYHREMAELAAKAIGNLPKEQRGLAGLTMGISRKTYTQIWEEIESFRKRLVEIVSKDEDTEATYQLNFHLFPLSNPKLKKQV